MTPRALIAGATMLTGLIGLAGLAIGARRRWRGHAMMGAYVLGFALPYAVVHPVPRHGYPMYGVLAFVAIDLLYRCGVAIRRKHRAQDA